MGFATFLTGCAVGVLVATLLSSHADLDQLEVPHSLGEAFSQIRSGWTRPTQMIIAAFAHPLLVCALLMALLITRRSWRSFVTRRLWLRAPATLKAVLELHSSLLGLFVMFALLVSSGAILQMADAVAVSGAVCPQAPRALHGVRLILSKLNPRSQRKPNQREPNQVLPKMASSSHMFSLAALTSLGPQPVLAGLLVQVLLPLLIHPSLTPRLLRFLSRTDNRSAAKRPQASDGDPTQAVHEQVQRLRLAAPVEAAWRPLTPLLLKLLCG